MSDLTSITQKTERSAEVQSGNKQCTRIPGFRLCLIMGRIFAYVQETTPVSQWLLSIQQTVPKESLVVPLAQSCLCLLAAKYY